MTITGAISLIVGIIGTCIAIYQWAVINEGKKRKEEFQFLLAGLNNSALQKQTAWQNHLFLLNKSDKEKESESIKLCLRAIGDFAELASLTIALEGTIDTESSAIGKMMDRSIEMVKKNNQLQNEGLKNPLLKKDNVESEH